MTKYDCDICCGRGSIRMPIRKRLAAVQLDVPAREVPIDSREYPCPECSESVPITRVNSALRETLAASYIEDPKYIEHVKGALARQLADWLLCHDYISFDRGPTDDYKMQFEMRATLGVVSKKRLANLDERIAERQIEVAQEVVEEAKAQINNWASHYGHSDILKKDATRLVGDSVKAVLARRNARVAT